MVKYRGRKSLPSDAVSRDARVASSAGVTCTQCGGTTNHTNTARAPRAARAFTRKAIRMIAAAPWGFRDILPEEALVRERIARTVQDCFQAHGYLPIETPVLENRSVLEAGGRIADTPFQLFDDDGRLMVVRSELTLPIIRMVSARRGALSFPLRVRYQGPVVREQPQLTGRERQFTQLGVELIGAGGTQADAEVVGLAADAAEALALPQWLIVCGSVRPLRAVLDHVANKELAHQVVDYVHENNLVDLDETVTAAERAGEVTPEVAAALREIPRVHGGTEALDRIDTLIAAAGILASATEELRALVAAFADRGQADRLRFDFSILNSFDYYTGLLFKVYAADQTECVCSGGRYDSSFDAGGASLPAAGFAFSLERIETALPDDTAVSTGVSAGKKSHSDGARLGAGSQGGAARPLRIAVPKGSLFTDAVNLLEAAGLDVSQLRNPGRHLIVPGGDDVEFVIVRASDAPAFVSCGGADCGMCGRDSLIEADLGLLQLADLRFGGCRFIEAEPADRAGEAERAYARRGTLRVATKYPKIAQRYYESRGIQADIVQLHGNIELGPIVGMTDRIVDITATGTTLRENNLVITGEILECTARFFVHPGRARLDPRVRELGEKLMAAVR